MGLISKTKTQTETKPGIKATQNKTDTEK